jgi:hypothetical protein
MILELVEMNVEANSDSFAIADHRRIDRRCSDIILLHRVERTSPWVSHNRSLRAALMCAENGPLGHAGGVLAMSFSINFPP